MAANANTACRFRIDGSFSYKRGTSPTRIGSGAVLRQATFDVSGVGAGQASKSHQQTFSINPSGTVTLDLASFTDQVGDPATWSVLKAAVLSHDAASLATGTIEVTGGAANAQAGLRSSSLLKGQDSVMLFDPAGAGMAVGGGGNSKIVIANNDSVNIATAVLFLEGG